MTLIRKFVRISPDPATNDKDRSQMPLYKSEQERLKVIHKIYKHIFDENTTIKVVGKEGNDYAVLVKKEEDGKVVMKFLAYLTPEIKS